LFSASGFPPRLHSFSGSTTYEAKDVFDTYEQELFSRAPGTNVFDAIIMTAQRLDSSRLVSGLSTKLSADEQAKFTGDAWERLPEPKPRLVMEVISPDGARHEYPLGPMSLVYAPATLNCYTRSG
jgi:hypothetical protein